MDVNRIIMESLQDVIGETVKETPPVVVEESVKEKAAEAVEAIKEKVGEVKEAAKDKLEDAKEAVKEKAEAAKEKGLDVKDHLVAAGKKAVKNVDDAMHSHPYAGAGAAAIAAGLGAVTLRKRLANASKKGKK